MPKTKEQKQQEAMERKQRMLPIYRDRLAEAHTNRGRWFSELQKLKPNDYLRPRYENELRMAEQRLKDAVTNLHRLCKELKCDTHGNML